MSRPRLETPRLVLRAPDATDAERMLSFARDNREHFAPWDPGRPSDYFTRAFWERRLDAVRKAAANGDLVQFILLERERTAGRVQGQCTFSNIVRGPFQAAHLGYGLDHRAVGKGLMREALEAAITYCFDELNLHRIIANYMPRNRRSARLVHELGFVVDGYAHEYLHIAGRWEDHVLSSRVNGDWRPE